jgi:hypothetical protein
MLRERERTRIVVAKSALHGPEYFLGDEHACRVETMQKLLAPAVHLHDQRRLHTRALLSPHIHPVNVFGF